jgi:hypothetical protein
MSDKKILFIHIPKTGGNSFLTHPFYLEKIVGLGHFESQKLDYTKNNYDTIFTIVRNPYSRLISAYFYLKKRWNEKSYRLILPKNIGTL